ncbi:MAG: glycosyltransferase family 2 protein [Patescibacteria group bacterium]
MKVMTVVLCFNSKKYIGECLQSLSKNNSDILIVDSGSTDGSQDYLKTNYNELKLISTKKNLGYAGGNNVGLRYALEHNYDFVWVVNPDIVVDSRALEEAMKVMTKSETTAVVASKVYFAPGFEFHKNRYSKKESGKVIWYAGGDNDWKNVFAIHYGMNEVDKGQYDKEKEVGFATGSSMLIRCEALRISGVIDEKYFLYYEENDLLQRIRKAGWNFMYAPKSLVWHKVGQAAGIGSPLADYYIARNRMLFGMRWAPFRTKLFLVRESLKLLFFGRRWQKTGIRDFYLRKLGKGSYA